MRVEVFSCDTVTPKLAHVPMGWATDDPVVTVYCCTGCAYLWRQDTSAAAAL